MHNRLFLVFVLILLCVCVVRVLTSKAETLPGNKYLKLEATIIKEPVVGDKDQIIYIKNLRIYTAMYPKYGVGDRIMVQGMADDRGRIFKAEVKKVGTRPVAFAFISSLRQKILGNIQQILPEREATLVSGTVLGVDTISADFKQALTLTGTIHVVVVSGQNLMIVAGSIMALAGYFGRRRCLVISLVCVFFYSILAGFEPPVIRASLIVLFSTVAIYFGREVNALWGLFLAGVLMVIVWPLAIFEISFQLTFAASLGIITLGQKLSTVFKRLPIVGEGSEVAISAFLFTMPIIVYYFGRVSILSPIVNMLVIEAVLPIMLFGFLISILSLIFMPIARLLAILVYPFTLYFSQVVTFFAKIDFGQISGGAGNIEFVMIYYLMLFLLILIWRKQVISDKR